MYFNGISNECSQLQPAYGVYVHKLKSGQGLLVQCEDCHGWCHYQLPLNTDPEWQKDSIRAFLRFLCHATMHIHYVCKWPHVVLLEIGFVCCSYYTHTHIYKCVCVRMLFIAFLSYPKRGTSRMFAELITFWVYSFVIPGLCSKWCASI